MDALDHLGDTMDTVFGILGRDEPVEFCDRCERVIGPGVNAIRCPTCGLPRRCVLTGKKVVDGMLTKLNERE